MEGNTGRASQRTLSQTLALILLTLIIVTSIVVIHSTIANFGIALGEDSGTSLLGGALIEEVVPLVDEKRPNYCYAIGIVVRNPTREPISSDLNPVFIKTDKRTILGERVFSWKRETIEPGSSFTAIYYPSMRINPDHVEIRLSPGTPSSGIIRKHVPCTLGRGGTVTLSKESEETKTLRLGNVSITLWLSNTGSNSVMVWFNITVNTTLPPGSIRGEVMLRETLGHPLGPVFHNPTEYVPGEVYMGYLGPVSLGGYEKVTVLWSLLR